MDVLTMSCRHVRIYVLAYPQSVFKRTVVLVTSQIFLFEHQRQCSSRASITAVSLRSDCQHAASQGHQLAELFREHHIGKPRPANINAYSSVTRYDIVSLRRP